MGSNDSASNQSETVETVQKLLALTQDESNDHESASAARKAVLLMRENGLVLVSAKELQKAEAEVRAAREELAKVRGEQKGNLVKGAIVGALLSKYL